MRYEKKFTDNHLAFDVCRHIKDELGISLLLSKLLYIRGIKSVPDARKYLYGTIKDLSSPYIFKDMQGIVFRIQKAIAEKQKILIYGDYDCDGVGAISILHLSFADQNVKVYHYIPVRAKEGYGLNDTAISDIKEKINPDLIITVDCGINSYREIELIRSLGMDVIVTDHHQPGQILPSCLILNPCLTEGATPLCGAGVAFTLVRALFGEEQAQKYIDICALSTVADIVPLVDDNRIIVKYGMDLIKKGKCRKGIKELLYASNANFRNLSTSDIGFKIAPRLNAAGRLSNAELSFGLLTSDDPTELHLLSENLSALNVERQNMNSAIFNETLQRLKSYDFSKYKLIMLWGNWNEGVVGIVCSKLVEYFNLPVILLCSQNDNGELKGSARSIPGVNLFEMFDKNNTLLDGYGGHEMAAGISFNIKHFDEILETFNQYILKTTTEDTFERKYYYDEILNVSDINNGIIAEIDKMEPFGLMNAAPIFLDTASNADFKQIGKTQHVKAKFKAGDLIAFDKLKLTEIIKTEQYSILYSFDKNFFNGKTSTQFIVKDIRLETLSGNDLYLLENFCKTFLPYFEDGNSQRKKKTNCEFPTLYVTYSFHTLKEFMKKNKDAKYFVFSQSGCELHKAIVLAPDRTFPFDYYSKIIFLNDIGVQLKKRLQAQNYPVEYFGTKIHLPKVSVDELRRYYSTLRNYFTLNRRYASAIQLFKEMYNGIKTDKQTEIKFILAFYILRELDLIKIGKDDIIKVVNEKVSLSTSTLYQYING